MKVKFSFLFRSFLLLSGLALGFSACKDYDGEQDRDIRPVGKYDQGVFIVNEGLFGGTGTITWHNPATGETVQDVFGKANNGIALGQFVQSLTFRNGMGYIVVNGANRIVVVDAGTFEYVDTIGGLILPRYLLAVDDQFAWVSQWGVNGVAGSIAKVDLTTRKVVKTIPLPGPEKMYLSNTTTLLVANSGGFGLDSTVSTINLSSETETNRKEVSGTSPGGFARAPFQANGPLVLCKGGFSVPNFDPLPGWVGSIATGTGFAIPNSSDDLCDAPNGKETYFFGGGSIWAIDATGLRKLFDQPAYGLGCHPVSGELYCPDPKDFNSNGLVSIRRTDGTVLSRFDCGIARGEVVFR